MNKRLSRGHINGAIIAIVTLVLLVLVFGSFSIWAYLNYSEQKRNVDGKIADAAAKARLEQADKDEADFAEREKQPLRQFVGPSDYGRLTFDYPKTWSAYQATDVSEGGGATYEAYLNPITVPPVTKYVDTKNDAIKFALRVKIEQKTYNQSLEDYAKQIEKGELKSSVYNGKNISGTRLVGNFTENIYGTAVVVKMRDRTLTLRTDGTVFNKDYEALLKTVDFNR